ncbi:hypothetical protein WR25_11653 [Diploscapter pachys]|uniref:Phosphodiesterase n=1 Tax=Diploscapter pachys TaxID=2018661 RepID=A0A2A2KTD9_9BILA|nr:hypothetical protein WR25_11653 [Diploscapter pachys]
MNSTKFTPIEGQNRGPSDRERCKYHGKTDATFSRNHKSLVSAQLLSPGTFVGVVELCNRIGKNCFSRHDEQKARTFAVYCATSVSHCLLYQKVLSAQGRTHMATELVVQGNQFLVSEDEIRRLLAEPVHEWRFFHSDFAQFSFSPRSIGNSQTYEQAALSMFQDLGFVQRYQITKRRLVSFVLRVSKGYREVPYHNWSHAFAVAHFCWLCLRTETARRGLDELERFALLIACLCHDIDHRGTTNSFQLQSKTPLAQLYSSEGSVLERHHYAQTVAILQMESCNILENLTNLQYKTVLSHIREVILATDIAVHLQKVDRIQNMVNNGYDSFSSDHHYLFRCLMITASDLSDQSKDFRNSKAIAENIYREFFSQGDLERQMGASPVAMMDREKACVPQIQLNFMDTIAVPVFEMVSKIIPEGLSTYKSIQHNRRCWKALHEISEEQGRPVNGGLEYLRDEELEAEVIARVKQEDQRQALLNNHHTNSSENNEVRFF